MHTFVTVVQALYDPGTRTLTSARGGHPPPLHLTPEGTATYLDGPGAPPLGCGVHAGGRVAPTSLQLERGDAVIFYTDGLIERRGESLDDGLARLRRVATANIGRSAEELCKLLAELVGSDARRDDVAVLVLVVS